VLIAIDGPAGAGKSTVARAVAGRLGFTYLDTGAMYRSVALAGDGADVDALDIRVGERVLLDGEDVTERIRTPEVTARVSEVSADPDVRAAMVRKQQALLRDGDWVAEGRDIGTVVAPWAQLKVFLTADPGERARRRALQTGREEAEVLREQEQRDERDARRAHSPLRPAEDAVQLDTTGLDEDAVVERIVALAERRPR
jgi:cytidylate kinase